MEKRVITQQLFKGLNEEDLLVVVKQIMIFLENASTRFVFLIGEMGSGKTTLMKTLIGQYSFEPFKGSPTFSICNQYDLKDPSQGGDFIYHLDLDRMRDEEDFMLSGLDVLLEGKDLIFVENERSILRNILIHSWVEVQLFYIDDENKRDVRLEIKEK